MAGSDDRQHEVVELQENDISHKTFQCIIFQDDHTRNVPSNMPDAKAVKGITLKGGVSYV